MATQQTMVNWAKDQIYKWIDMDGAYGAQCVDLIMAYVKNFANFRVSGNAIDYLTNTLPNGWRRYRKGEAAISPGDIAIWHWGSWDKYGHVGIVIDVRSNIITSVEQNVDGTPERGGAAKIMARDDTYLVGFIRPPYDNGENWTRIPEQGRFIVEVTEINVRTKPSIFSQKVDSYTTGEKVFYDSYVINEGLIWISYISYKGERHYIATGACKNGKRISNWGRFLQ